MGGPWGTQGGGGGGLRSPPPRDIRPFGGSDFRPLGPLVMWNDDDDGDDHIKTLVPTYLVQIICPGITLTITPI